MNPDHRWPIGIAVALLVFVAVQVSFVTLAVRTQDEVVPSYTAAAR
jgi:hypothetical protein